MGIRGLFNYSRLKPLVVESTMSKEQSIELIEKIYSTKKDKPYPGSDVNNPIMLLASYGGYITGTDFGFNRYDSAVEIYEALLSVENHYHENPEDMLLQKLQKI